MSALHIAPASDGRWRPVVLEGGEAAARPVEPGDEAAPVAAASAPAVATGAGPDRVDLAPPTRAAAWRRRAGVAAVPVALALGLSVLFGGTADAGPAEPVAGTATIAPGETLWDVAAATAPDGTDTRDQLGRIVELNGFDGDRVEPWTVVLLPAR